VIVEVALVIPLRQIFDYKWPSGWNEPKLGQRVLVPFRRQKKCGLIIGIKEKTEFSGIRQILSLLDEHPIITRELLDLTRWVAQYYFCGWGEVLQAALPGGLGVHLQSEYSWETSKLDQSIVLPKKFSYLLLRESWTDQEWKELRPSITEEELRQHWLESGVLRVQRHLVQQRAKIKTERWVRLKNAPFDKLGKSPRKKTKRQRLLEMLQENTLLPWLTLRDQIKAPASLLKQLVEEQIVETFEQRVFRRFLPQGLPEPKEFQELTLDQQKVWEPILESLNSNEYKAFLLHGVTGSGKTEVYLHAVRRCLKLDRTALVLVPEISLTPQLVNRFRERYGDLVAVLHSGMDDGERFDEWSRIQLGQAKIAIGARSAIFAPLHNLGLVVIDEEHDQSYKQGESPRYQGRDVAVYRAFQVKATVILGSATPCLESWQNTKTGKYQLLELPSRALAGAQLPDVELLDLSQQPRQSGCYFFTKELVEALRICLQKKEQAILFLNRRGYAPVVQCPECANTINCDACSLSLVYHQSSEKLCCHQCDHTQGFPKICPHCGTQTAMRLLGTGTEQIEQDLRVVFPEARLLRMDRDTLHGKHALSEMQQQIQRHEVDIVIGTQLVTKGHDFPNVTLVGVLLADLGLNLPDFRSGERTFQLLTQVAGRAGRGKKPGRVLIQTNNPHHHSLLTAQSQNYNSFVNQELPLRERLRQPPFSSLASVLCISRDENRAQNLAFSLRQNLRSNSQGQVICQGPAEAPIRRIKHRFRWQVLIRATSAGLIRQIFEKSLFGPEPLICSREENIILDIDPQQLM
jgi:primosomal protein N' (replication factor Y)